MYIDDPFDKRQKQLKQFSDPLNQKANLSPQAQNNPNNITPKKPNTVVKGANNLKGNNLTYGAQKLKNQYVAVDDLNNYNNKVKTVKDARGLTANDYLYDNDGQIDFMGTIQSLTKQGRMTPNLYNSLQQARVDKMNQSPDKYGYLPTDTLSPSELMEMYKGSQGREGLKNEFENQYSDQTEYAKNIGRYATMNAEAQKKYAVDTATREAEELKKQVENEWYTEHLPALNERIANMGTSAHGGFSIGQQAKLQGQLMSEINDIELEKQRTIAEAEREYAELMLQGKTEEAKALIDIANNMNNAYNERISELDKQAQDMTALEVDNQRHNTDNLFEKTEKGKDRNHDFEVMDKEQTNKKEIIGIEHGNTLEIMDKQDYIDDGNAERDFGHEKALLGVKSALSGSSNVMSIDDGLVSINRYTNGNPGATANDILQLINSFPMSNSQKQTLMELYAGYTSEDGWKIPDGSGAPIDYFDKNTTNKGLGFPQK